MQIYAANSKCLFKSFISIYDSKSNISNRVKAFKILDKYLNRSKFKSDKLYEKGIRLNQVKTSNLSELQKLLYLEAPGINSLIEQRILLNRHLAKSINLWIFLVSQSGNIRMKIRAWALLLAGWGCRNAILNTEFIDTIGKEQGKVKIIKERTKTWFDRYIYHTLWIVIKENELYITYSWICKYTYYLLTKLT